MNKKLKSFLMGAWDCLVFFAYIKFYILCLTTFVLVLVLSVYVLSEAGSDITALSTAIPIAIWFATFWVFIILIDKGLNFKLTKNDASGEQDAV